MASPPPRRLGSLPTVAVALFVVLAVGACASSEAASSEADRLGSELSSPIPEALANEPGDEPTVSPSAPRRSPPTTATPPIDPGDPTRPFSPLPSSDEATAVVTPSGVVMPVVADRSEQAGHDAWLVVTPCADARVITGAQPLGRAHIVLDPGHGGREFGSVGPNGVVEKDLNLAVALAAEAMLEEVGATVLLTRSTDLSMTTGVRAQLARAIQPALFVSIHHNGGAPANGDRPGTIVFTKGASGESTRFGGLFHQTLTPRLAEVAEVRREEFRVYADAFVANEEAIAAYDRSMVARDAALVANGQIDPTGTTLPPPPPDDVRDLIDGTEVASTRQPVTTTTMPAPPDQPLVPVPDTAPLPGPFEAERVLEFRWAGSGNAGVRSWLADDGRDLLSVLRRSGNVPAALVEFLYVTNPVEESLLADPAFIELEARALADSIIRYLSTPDEGTGFVADQVGDQNIGGGGHRNDCIEPYLGLDDE